MPLPAQVKSIDALDAFRAKVLVYRDKAGRILDDVHHDAIRTRTWLETDRQLHWRHLIRQRTARLAQAEQELLTARLSGHQEAIQDRRMTVNKAREALRDAEAGLARVHHWLRHYEAEVLSRLKGVAQLRLVLANDLEKALAFLEGAATILTDYASLAPTGDAPPRHVPAGADPAAASPAPGVATSEPEGGGP